MDGQTLLDHWTFRCAYHSVRLYYVLPIFDKITALFLHCNYAHYVASHRAFDYLKFSPLNHDLFDSIMSSSINWGSEQPNFIV